MTNQRYRVEWRPEAITALLPQVIEIADAEKEALGFLTESAYRDAAARRRLYLMVCDDASEPVVAGFILFGGVYPNGRVQQIGVRPDCRRSKIGSRLLTCLASDLEKQGYLTLTAKIASDLPHALNFYRQNGFEQVAARRGGSARNRDILVHVRQLDTPHLFSAIEKAAINISVKNRIEAPLYAFDLNVFFDLARSRVRHDQAASLFSAALAHRIRLAVSREFVEELRRTSVNVDGDPILQMALRLPQLPKVDSQQLDKLAAEIHKIVFELPETKGGGTPQARSDCRHLAHASISRAAAFVTSDNAILRRQKVLLALFGIDVVPLDELLEAHPQVELQDFVEQKRIGGYEVTAVDVSSIWRSLAQECAPKYVMDKYQSSVTCTSISWRGAVVAFGCLGPYANQDHRNLLVHVEPHHTEPEALADYLISAFVRLASRDGPAKLVLDVLPGQSAVRQIARVQGFQELPRRGEMVKVAIGRPLTPSHWGRTIDLLRRRTGVSISWDERSNVLRVADPAGAEISTGWAQLEELLGPTLVAFPGRAGVIVPIAKKYADELLDTAPQLRLAFVDSSGATLLAKRGYVNSTRAAKAMSPGSPIFFYESARSQGRAAIVAVGRIVDSVVVEKDAVGSDDKSRLVVDDLDIISSTAKVLLTTFDNILTFPRPVPLAVMRCLGAVGSNNLISATPVEHENAVKILEWGWADG